MNAGRRRGERADKDRAVAVDDELEQRIHDVEASVDNYLERQDDTHRAVVASALASLDEQIAASDGYHARASALASTPYSSAPMYRVVGETGRVPLVDDVPVSEFQAQAALVRAAKLEVADTSPATMAALWDAKATLADVRSSR